MVILNVINLNDLEIIISSVLLIKESSNWGCNLPDINYRNLLMGKIRKGIFDLSKLN